MLRSYRLYDPLTSFYGSNLTRLTMLAELESQLTIKDRTNEHLITKMRALQKENQLLRMQRYLGSNASSTKLTKNVRPDADINQRLKESRRRRKVRQEQSSALQRAVDVLSASRRPTSCHNSRLSTHPNPLTHSTYTLRDPQNIPNSRSVTQLHPVDYKPDIEIHRHRHQQSDIGPISYEQSGMNTENGQEGIVRNVAPKQYGTKESGREVSARGISLSRDPSPVQGKNRNQSSVVYVREVSPQPQPQKKVVIKEEPVLVRSTYPSPLPQAPPRPMQSSAVRLEQVEISQSGYFDAGARINSEPLDMKASLCSHLRNSSMRGKKSFLSVISKSSKKRQ